MTNIIRTIIAIAGAIVILSIYILMSTTDKIKQGAETKVNIGDDFALTDQDNNDFISLQIRGKISLVYFGFTYCPDICPTTLQKMASAMAKIEPKRKPINALFITVDPYRDSPESLKQYISQFGPDFLALTGSEAEVKKVADKFKVYYARSGNNSPHNRDYLIDHTSFIYVMDQNFKYLKHFTINSTSDEIAEYLRSIGA